MNVIKIMGFVTLAATIVLSSCTGGEAEAPSNTSVGYAAEMHITTTPEVYDYLKLAIANNLAKPQAYLTPEEPKYFMTYIGPDALKGSFLDYQNQVYFVTEENKKEMSFLKEFLGPKKFDSITNINEVGFYEFKDIWAVNQSIFMVYGPTVESIRLYLRDASDVLNERIYLSELKNFASRICDYDNPNSKTIKTAFKIDIGIPDFVKIDNQKDSFIGLNWQEGDANCNILIGLLNQAPNTESSKELMLAQREDQGKKYLQMDSLGIYYIGTSKMFEQYYSPWQINGNQGGKINGWWVIDGKFRGGPYTRYTVFHKASNQWISIEALVYYPNVQNRKDGKTKTRFLRTLEAIISTLK